MYLLLFGFWLLLNGRITLEIILFGIAIVLAAALLEKILFGYTPLKELRLIRKTPLAAAYLAVLFIEIMKASFQVVRVILFRKIPVHPSLVSFHTDLKTEFGRFLLANSITLTPGTITVSVAEDTVTVHCLDASMLDTSENSVFQRWIRKLEG